MAETKKNFTYAIGRRKAAVARVRLYKGAGDIVVNGKKISEIFTSQIDKTKYEKPFQTVGGIGKYSATIKVVGGGISGQLDAIVLGISRAISVADEESKKALRKAGLLTRDARVRERRKVGTGGKARRAKQSPKR